MMTKRAVSCSRDQRITKLKKIEKFENMGKGMKGEIRREGTKEETRNHQNEETEIKRFLKERQGEGKNAEEIEKGK